MSKKLRRELHRIARETGMRFTLKGKHGIYTVKMWRWLSNGSRVVMDASLLVEDEVMIEAILFLDEMEAEKYV